MKKLLLALLLLSTGLFTQAVDIGDKWYKVYEDTRSKNLEILDIHSDILKVEDCCIIITYIFKNDTCVSIKYEVEPGFYRDNLLKINRLNDIPYEKMEFIYNNLDNTIQVFKLPYND